MALPRPALLVLGIVALLVLTALVTPFGEDRLWHLIFEGGHALVFGLVALGLLGLASRRSLRYRGAFLGALGLGALLELVQIPIGRDATWSDVGRDLLGIVAALVGAASFDPRLEWGRSRRLAGWLLAVALLGVAFAPALSLAGAYLARRQAFPVVAAFDRRWERPLVSAYHGARLVYGPSVSGRGSGAWVEFPARGYPQLVIRVRPDWSGYRDLVIDLELEGEEAADLMVVVYDEAHRSDPPDRYNGRHPIHPGFNSIRIPIDEVLRAPATRRMDPRTMKAMALVGPEPESPFTLWVDEIRLEGTEP